ncbi:MAG: type II toxin-antitoxin system VapB family antitoxin [Chloroflexi bacterium]|nr:type II toxin-antitoxin system VapB family antitoxin [Chloroflexota bacterium]
MKRTTILADEDLLLEVKHLAAQEGKTLAEAVREALRAYVQAHRQPRRLSFVGAGRSGEPSVVRREESILTAEIDAIEGWSPRRRALGSGRSAGEKS